MSVTLQELRKEHADEVIGAKLKKLCEDVVKATARTYPAAEYSDAGVWNRESLEDAVQGWVEVRLFGRGDLSKMLARAVSAGSLRGMLTRSFEQFLVNRRPPSAVANLYSRTTKMLRADDAFVAVGDSSASGEQLWTVAEGGREEPATMPLRELVAIAFELDDKALKVVRYKPDSEYESPILRTPKLKEFLVYVLGRAGGALDQATIAEVMTRRFDLATVELVELEPTHGDVAPQLSDPERRQVVASVIRRLGQGRVEELQAFHRAARPGQEVTEIDDLPGAVSETIAMIAPFARSPEEADEIYDNVVAALI
jgi:hypothetical protein